LNCNSRADAVRDLVGDATDARKPYGLAMSNTQPVGARCVEPGIFVQSHGEAPWAPHLLSSSSPLWRHAEVTPLGILEVILLVILVMALFGGGYGYSRRSDWGSLPAGALGLLVLILMVFLVSRAV
jgi:hypothetical protein